MSFNPEYFYPTIITNIVNLNGGLLGTVKPTDIYPAVDVTDQTQSPTGTTKPYQIIQLVNFILGNFGFYTYAPVLAASTTNLTATYNNGVSGVGATLTNAGAQASFTLDGQAGVMNGRYLIKNQTSAFQNGIYQLTTIGTLSTNWVLTRTADFNQPSPPPNIEYGGIVFVSYGSTYANTYWQDTFTSPLVVGTTSILWNEWSLTPAELEWQVVTTPSVNAQVQNGYITNRSTQVQVLLPANFDIGDEVIILGQGTGGWSLLTNAGQTIQFGSVTAMNSISSDIQYSNITVRGLVPGTTWTVIVTNSNPTFS